LNLITHETNLVVMKMIKNQMNLIMVRMKIS